jgi:hypothetical protein
LVRTINGGANWLVVTTGSSTDPNVSDIFVIDQSSIQMIVEDISSNATVVWKSTDGGTSWSSTPLAVTSTVSSIHYISHDSGMVVGQNPGASRLTVWRTTNSGLSWDSAGLNIPAVNPPEGVNHRSLYMMGLRAWFLTNQRRVLYTTNFGTNWVSQQLSPSYPTSSGNVWFNSPTLGMAGCLNVPSITTNAGNNWTPQTEPTGFGQVKGVIGAGNNFWCTYGLNVNFTPNYGANWTVVYTAPANNFSDMSLARYGTCAWAVRDGGRISKGLNLVGVKPVSNEIPSEFSLSQNYPNPFNPVTIINYELPITSYVKLSVYDILGREVAVLVNPADAGLKPGTYEVEWDASNYPSGIYFYKLETNEFSETKKMMLIK